MVTELIAVGTEILLGNIVNTNSAYLSEKCAELGLAVYYQSVFVQNPVAEAISSCRRPFQDLEEMRQMY